MVVLTVGCSAAEEEPTLVPDIASRSWDELSDAEKEVVQKDLDFFREARNMPSGVATPEPIRVIPRFEVVAVLIDCLREEGLEVELVMGDGIQWQGDSSQASLFDEAVFRCNAMYPVRPDQTGSPVTEEQFLRSYEYQTETLPECLAQYDVIVENPPSYEVWRETQEWPEMTKTYDNFPREKYTLFAEVCPRNTPPEVLYVIPAE